MRFEARRTSMSTRPYSLAKPLAENPRPIVPGARICHEHLKVANLARALASYTGVLGFKLIQRFGNQPAIISAGVYCHHIALNTTETKDHCSPASSTTAR